MLSQEELKSLVSLLFIEKVGNKMAKTLFAYCGSASEVFKTKPSTLKKIPGVGEKLLHEITTFDKQDKVEQELKYIEDNQIHSFFYLKEDYPHRLKQLEDCPFLFFSKGNPNLNHSKIIAIVGSRNATEYGKAMTDEIIQHLVPYNPIIVSGLAYGTDYNAHKSALKHNLTTVGVVAHGFNYLYPAAHRNIASKMIKEGGAVITEYTSDTQARKEFFPIRNRIVAGLSDAVILVESSDKGGAMITAEIAYSYDREVMTLPGKTTDAFSAGCNILIQRNVASMILNPDDVIKIMGWDVKKSSKPKLNLSSLTEHEQVVYQNLLGLDKLDIDTLSIKTDIPTQQLSILLLNMEFNGFVQSLPGSCYRAK